MPFLRRNCVKWNQQTRQGFDLPLPIPFSTLQIWRFYGEPYLWLFIVDYIRTGQNLWKRYHNKCKRLSSCFEFFLLDWLQPKEIEPSLSCYLPVAHDPNRSDDGKYLLECNHMILALCINSAPVTSAILTYTGRQNIAGDEKVRNYRFKCYGLLCRFLGLRGPTDSISERFSIRKKWFCSCLEEKLIVLWQTISIILLGLSLFCVKVKKNRNTNESTLWQCWNPLNFTFISFLS